MEGWADKDVCHRGRHLRRAVCGQSAGQLGPPALGVVVHGEASEKVPEPVHRRYRKDRNKEEQRVPFC
eukprot:4157008-Pyramimonas_sp.AAC.1